MARKIWVLYPRVSYQYNVFALLLLSFFFVLLLSAIFSGSFITLYSQSILSFWAKNCSMCVLESSRELKFLPLRELCKDWNKWKSKGAMSSEYSRWIRTSQPRCKSLCLVTKETCSLALPWGKIMCFLLTNSGHFSSSAAFSWSYWEQYLSELINWFSGGSF